MLQISLPEKIRPTKGFSHAFHVTLKALLPVLTYVFIRIDMLSLAILIIFLSKWRMFAVRPRYWMANLISNGVDIMVAVALVIFMANTSVEWWQIFWAGAYAAWLIWLKPRYDAFSVSAQAMIGQLLGLSVIYLKFGDASLPALVAVTWLVAYLAARHFLTNFDEVHPALLSHVWAYFSASLTFVLGHWLLFYGTVAQIIVVLTTIGYGLAALYYLEATDRLTPLIKRQLIGIMCAILLIIVVLSNWTGATV